MDYGAICWKRGFRIQIEIVSGANLYRANLSGADLSFVIGLVHVDFASFSMYIQVEYTKIGCKYMKNSEWLAMDIDTAARLGIEREHFSFYHAAFEAAMLILLQEDK